MLAEGALENAVLSAECLHSTAELFPLHTANYLISSYCLTFIGEALQQIALSRRPFARFSLETENGRYLSNEGKLKVQIVSA